MTTKQIHASSLFRGEDTGEGDNHHLGSFTTTYQYDYNNLLTEIQFPNHKTNIFRNCSCGTKRVYKKDEEGRVSTYFFDTINGLSQVLVVYNQNDRPKKIYTYGNTTDQPISMQYREGGRWRTSYYLYDGQGNVRQLTNSRGQIIATYNYLPFGEMMNKGMRGQGMGITLGRLQNWGRKNELRNTITYQGREYDRDSGFYYFRARYQDPRLGRFLEVDPILREVPNYTTGSTLPASGNSGCGCGGNLLNTYSSIPNIIFTPAYIFIGNNPVNWKDPEGYQTNNGSQGAIPVAPNPTPNPPSVPNSYILKNFPGCIRYLYPPYPGEGPANCQDCLGELQGKSQCLGIGFGIIDIEDYCAGHSRSQVLKIINKYVKEIINAKNNPNNKKCPKCKNKGGKKKWWQIF